MEAAESLFDCLEQVADPRKARGVRHSFQAILRLTLLGLVCGQTTMAHISLFARMHWTVLKEPLGFVRDQPPHATTISRTLAGVPCEQLQGVLTGWVARVVADQDDQEDQELSASVDGKWAKQSVDANGNPLVMVKVLAHDLKLCLAQWPASEKRYEPAVLREQLGRLLEDYPGLGLLTMDALYAERDLCRAIVSHGRDYLVRIKGNQPEVLAALADGFAVEELGEPKAETVEKKPGVIEKRRIWTGEALADYIRDELGFPGARQGAMVEKETVDPATGEVSREQWYLLTSLISRRCGPKELLRVFRNHWRVENSLHHVKDRSWDEDVHTLRRPGLGEIYATLVNTALNALRLEGWFPRQMSMPLRAKVCSFRPTQTIARLYGQVP